MESFHFVALTQDSKGSTEAAHVQMQIASEDKPVTNKVELNLQKKDEVAEPENTQDEEKVSQQISISATTNEEDKEQKEKHINKDKKEKDKKDKKEKKDKQDKKESSRRTIDDSINEKEHKKHKKEKRESTEEEKERKEIQKTDKEEKRNIKLAEVTKQKRKLEEELELLKIKTQVLQNQSTDHDKTAENNITQPKMVTETLRTDGNSSMLVESPVVAQHQQGNPLNLYIQLLVFRKKVIFVMMAAVL